MPLYEYRCNECGKTFEVLQKMNAEPLKTCIHCNGKVEKLISTSSFQFKGSGWYITDYKNKKARTDKSDNNNTDKSTNTNTDKANEGHNNNATIK